LGSEREKVEEVGALKGHLDLTMGNFSWKIFSGVSARRS
jgi:hypothetical protein